MGGWHASRKKLGTTDVDIHDLEKKEKNDLIMIGTVQIVPRTIQTR